MLTVNNINIFPINRQENNSLNFRGQKSSLVTDVFELQKDKNALSEQEKNKAIFILLKQANQRYLSPNSITTIVNGLNKKNYPYLEKILNLHKNFRDYNISTILDYIKEASTSTKDVDEKFNIINSLPERIENIGYKRNSEITDLFSRISPITCQNLITSDILLNKKNPNLRNLDECIGLIYETLEHKYEKYLASADQNPVMKQSLKKMAQIKISQIIDFNLEGMLITTRIADKDLLNEFIFNRLGNFDDIYTSRLKLLTPEDIKVFQKVSENGIKKDKSKIQPMLIDDKVELISFLAINRMLKKQCKENIDLKQFSLKNLENGAKYVDFEKIKEAFIIPSLMYIGISRIDAEKYKQNYIDAKSDGFKNISKDNFWDTDFMYLFTTNNSEEMKEVIQKSTLSDFAKYIHDKTEIQGRKNLQNHKIFLKENLDYSKWIKPDIREEQASFCNKTGGKAQVLTVKLWDRNPKKSIFDGNYTTCCTGIDKFRRLSFPKYLLNTAFNMIEVRNDNDEVVGMSRLFMAKINNIPSLVIDNIEVNNKFSKHYLNNDESKQRYREMIFEYARNFAKSINKDKNRNIPIYFCSKYFKVKDIAKDLGSAKYCKADFIGNLPQNVYINSYGDDYDSINSPKNGFPLALSLIDVTNKVNLTN